MLLRLDPLFITLQNKEAKINKIYVKLCSYKESTFHVINGYFTVRDVLVVNIINKEKINVTEMKFNRNI